MLLKMYSFPQFQFPKRDYKKTKKLQIKELDSIELPYDRHSLTFKSFAPIYILLQIPRILLTTPKNPLKSAKENQKKEIKGFQMVEPVKFLFSPSSLRKFCFVSFLIC